LVGAGDGAVDHHVRELETTVVARSPRWGAGLADAGLRHERRSLRLRVNALRWVAHESDTWVLEFDLQRGQFATAVLRECGRFVS
jgi:tRNA pseudouridine13 synthase